MERERLARGAGNAKAEKTEKVKEWKRISRGGRGGRVCVCVCLFRAERATRTEERRRTYPSARALREEGEGVCVVIGQGVGNDHTTPEESGRKSGEGKDVAMCARCRKAVGKSDIPDEERREREDGGREEREEGTPRRRDGGAEKERGGQTG